jgi:hypothetical protein
LYFSISYVQVADKFILMLEEQPPVYHLLWKSILPSENMQDAQHPFSIAVTIPGVLTEQGDPE